MIPSFHPLHAAARARAAGISASETTLVTPPSVDPDTGLAKKTTDQLLSEAAAFRYVDNPHIDYASLLAPEAGQLRKVSPLTSSGGRAKTRDGRSWENQPASAIAPTVAVVGGGLSGLLTALELQKTGLQVTLFEAGPPPLISPSTTALHIGAGRISESRVDPGISGTMVELGAMRFPSKSYLFWHYIYNAVQPESGYAPYVDFPNPGKVPTLFTGDKVAGVWKNGGLSLPATYQALNDRHMSALLDYSPPGGPGKLTILDIMGVLQSAPSGGMLQDITDFWRAASKDLYRKSYQTFLEEAGFSADEIDKIGTTGLGTGGFAPLFGVSVLDIMRLVLWQFDAELEVPDLFLLPEQLLEASHAVGVVSQYSTLVTSIIYGGGKTPYTVETSDRVRGSFGYVVLAMTHQAARYLLANSFGQASPGLLRAIPDAVIPFYDARYGNLPSSIRTELEAQTSMSGVKIFHAMAGPGREGAADTASSTGKLGPWTRFNATTLNSYDNRVRAMFGRFTSGQHTALGVSYMMPQLMNEPLKSEWYTGLHYSWGPQASEVFTEAIMRDPLVGPAVKATGVFAGTPSHNGYNYGTGLSGYLAEALSLRFIGFQNDASVKGSPGDLIPYFATESTDERQHYFAVVHWDYVPNVWAGFKLDAPGVGAHLIYGYLAPLLGRPDTSVWDNWTATDGYRCHPSVSGLFFAGDSFSHCGGWAEGAFQSALATSTALVTKAAMNSFPSEWPYMINQAWVDAFVNNAPNPYSDY